jgi:hypothetical protein
MYWDVINVVPESDFSLSVSFKDGTTGKVFFEETHLTGVFSLLRDPAYFRLVSIDNGVVAWPDDIDLAPDAMYREIKRCGKWVLN